MLDPQPRFQRTNSNKSEWVVVSAFPYRALNQFDLFIFEHPGGGVPGHKYGYYLRALLVVPHSEKMKAEIETHGDELLVEHEGREVTKLRELHLGP